MAKIITTRKIRSINAIGILSKPGFPKKVSEEIENIFNDPLVFLPQEICDKTLVPQELCLYSDQELESAESLRTLKCCDLRTNGHFYKDLY